MRIICFLFLTFFSLSTFAQVVPEDDDEDYDIYGDVEYSDGENKNYANAKIFGLSPARFVSVGWDVQGPYDMKFSEIGAIHPDSAAPLNAESARANYTGGLRINANVPIISTNKVIWQGGVNYAQSDYIIDNVQLNSTDPTRNSLASELGKQSLRTAGIFSTLYKPYNETDFLLFQGQADMSGDYSLGNLQELSTIRYSAAVLWGRRPHDRKQWAIGMSRTYKVGALNYIPILLFNYTSVNRKWGAEVLFPARAHYRYTFSPRSLLLIGYELEGQSYRIDAFSPANASFEIRRGELRPRFDYQRQLVGFFWLSVQGGVRINYSYDADFLPDNKEFFRGFFGSQSMAMLSDLGTAPYFNIAISFVSP